MLTVELIATNIQQLSSALPGYKMNLGNVNALINTTFNIDVTDTLKTFTKGLDYASLLSSIFSSLTSIFSNAFTILLYLLLLLIEESHFPKKIKAIYTDAEKYTQITKVLNKIDHSIGDYIALKTFVSTLTGLASYVALWLIGIDASLFWAFLIFILNFIPTIGSLIATAFLTIFALLQFGEINQALLVLVVIGVIQLIIGNLVEPKIMAKSLNISPLVVFLALTIWGVIWGITGMLLSVPITVIMIIIMAELPASKPIAILLSQNGKLSK